MDYKVIWSTSAVNDIDTISEYIARDSPMYASAVASKILDTTESLYDMSRSG